MSQGEDDKNKVLAKVSSKFAVSKSIHSNEIEDKPGECEISSPSTKELMTSKLFSWNCEKPRPTSVYLDRDFTKPSNIVAPEVREIGGLGKMRCLKKKKRLSVVNRPTRVQQICHTKTKPLPNFPLTEQLRTVTCPEKRKFSVLEAAERTKFADNLPSPRSSSQSNLETKTPFNHQNPFSLDLSALSKYQKEKHDAEELNRRRNYQIIRRTMETKALKTDGVKQIEQEARNEKFRLPHFFKFSRKNDSVKTEKIEASPASGCKYVSTMDKPKSQFLIQQHYQHKEDKLRKQVYEKAKERKKLLREIEEAEEEERGNFVFRLADESLPESERDGCERVPSKQFQFTYEKFDYPQMEESEFKQKFNEKSSNVLVKGGEKGNNASDETKSKEEIDTSYGQKTGSRTILRSFHDRICEEPRGRSNKYHLKRASTRRADLSHKQWLDSLANDSEMLKQPPRNQLMSSLRANHEPCDDKMIIFNDNSLAPQNCHVQADGAIRKYIHETNEKLKVRLKTSKSENFGSSTANKRNNLINNLREKRNQRMKFMGIPTDYSAPVQRTASHEHLRDVVDKISQNSIVSSREVISNEKFLGDSNINYKQSGVLNSPRDAKLIPKIPKLDCDKEKERKPQRLEKYVLFKKAQPRGSDARNLRVDKSLAWIEDELNETKARLAAKTVERKASSENAGEKTQDKFDVQKKQENDDNTSALKMKYNEIIANKFQDYKTIEIESVGNDASDDDELLEVQGGDVDSESSFSSRGTYFTNDSGSCVYLVDEKIAMKDLNIQKQFQNRSLLTTEEKELTEAIPFFIPPVGQLDVLKKMCKPRDKFHTYRSRSCANIRERIHIDSIPYEQEIIGKGKFKMHSNLATDIDDCYRSEFYNERSRIKFKFQPITEIIKLRESLRKKMDIYWMQEKEFLVHVHGVEQKKVTDGVFSVIDEYDKFLDSYKEQSYRKSIKLTSEVKNYYQKTKELRESLENLQNLHEPLKMRIYYLGIDFSEAVGIQNFQFLLKPLEWRQKHDYIHRTADGQLEGSTQSIKNRSTANLWDPNNVTIYTIKSYIETVHMKKDEKIIPVFENGADLLSAYKQLQSKSYLLLAQFHTASNLFSNLEKEFSALEISNAKLIDNLYGMVKNIDDSNVFLNNRTKYLKQSTVALSERPLEEAMSNEVLRSTHGLIEIMFGKVVLKNGNQSLTKCYTFVEKLEEMEKKVFDLLKSLDEIPKELIEKIEKRIRMELKQELTIAEKAYRIELELAASIEQFKRCMAKPVKNLQREKRLFRRIVKKSILEEKGRKASTLDEEYIKAFTGLGLNDKISLDEQTKEMIQKIKNESTPLYLDHFLATLGIKIPRISRTQVLLDEEEKLPIKDIIPNIHRKVKLWEKAQEQVKQKNIGKTLYLYPTE